MTNWERWGFRPLRFRRRQNTKYIAMNSARFPRLCLWVSERGLLRTYTVNNQCGRQATGRPQSGWIAINKTPIFLVTWGTTLVFIIMLPWRAAKLRVFFKRIPRKLLPLTPLLRACQKALTNKFWWGYWRECRRQGRGGEGRRGGWLCILTSPSLSDGDAKVPCSIFLPSSVFFLGIFLFVAKVGIYPP